jgi:hypothetical protein
MRDAGVFLACCLVLRQAPAMSPDRLEECLSALRWLLDTLAGVLECDASLIGA